MSLVVFGGAFDPIHLGHEAIIDFLVSKPGVDQLVLVPTGIPVYKESTFFSGAFRLQMIRAVAKRHANIDVIDYEIQQRKPSYTVDTLMHLQGLYPDQEIVLVVGFDQLYQFHRWRRYEEVLDMVKLWVINRDGIDQDKLMLEFPEELLAYIADIQFQSLLPPMVSSSKIRLMIKKGQAIDHLVSLDVLNYIQLFMTE